MLVKRSGALNLPGVAAEYRNLIYVTPLPLTRGLIVLRPNQRNGVVPILLGALLLVCAPSAFTQTLTTGDVGGSVTDATGAIVPNVTVTLKSTETNSVRTAVTNSAGQYRFSLLNPGEYSLSAAATGLKSGTTKMTVLVGQNLEVNLSLAVQGTQQVVEVMAEAAVVQTENANLTTAFSTR